MLSFIQIIFILSYNFLGVSNSINDIFQLPKEINHKVAHKWKTRYTALTRRNDQQQFEKRKKMIDDFMLDSILIGSRLKRKYVDFQMDCDFLYEISNKLLQRVCMPERTLFELNRNEKQMNQNLSNYYTNNLVEISSIQCGALLKDWSTIPGRDCVFDGIFADNNNKLVEEQPQQEVDDEMEIEIIENIENNGTSITADATVIYDTKDNEAIENEQSNSLEISLNHINTQIHQSQNFGGSSSDISVQEMLERCISPDIFDEDDEAMDCKNSSSEFICCKSKENCR